jgi:HD-like signal output (HDOD) protein
MQRIRALCNAFLWFLNFAADSSICHNVQTAATPEIKGAIPRQTALTSLRKLPAMSASAARLLRQLSRRDCDLTAVAALIEKDPVLSAEVVQSANSVTFSRSQHVESVLHAIVMVGVGTIRKFALIRTVSHLFSRRAFPADFSMTRFNLHSVAVAAMMELLAEYLPLEHSEGAFLAGLFHDVGTVLIAASMPEQYESTLAVSAVTGQDVFECESSVLGTDHAELSGLALELWGLPEPVRAAVAHHHAPQLAQAPHGTACVPLSLAVNKVDALVDALGMSIQAPRAVAVPPPARIEFDGYELDQTHLLDRFAVEWKAIDAMLR